MLDFPSSHVSARGAPHHGGLEHPRHGGAFIGVLLAGIIDNLDQRLLSISAARVALAGVFKHIPIRHAAVDGEQGDNVATPAHDLHDNIATGVVVVLSVPFLSFCGWHRHGGTMTTCQSSTRLVSGKE